MNMPTNHDDFNGLVSESLKTNSRIIAEKFEKRHTEVLRAIRDLIQKNEDWGLRNFASFKINDLTGESTSHYEMTRDGYSMLVMGFTGKKAMDWKIKFLTAFNAMEAKIKEAGGFSLPQTYPEALRLAAEQAEQIEVMKPKAVALDRLGASEGSQGLRVAAKAIGVQERKFIRWLHANNWIFRQGKVWQGYSEKVKQGYLEHETRTFTDATGEDRTSVQLRITPKGMARLAQIFGKGGAA